MTIVANYFHYHFSELLLRCFNVFTFTSRVFVTSCNDGLRFQVVDAKKVALQNFLAPSNKKVTLTNGLKQ